MKRVKRTISRKHANSLHADIRRARQIEVNLQREAQHLTDALADVNKKADKAQCLADDLATKLNQKSEELGRANTREIAARLVAEVLIDGVNTLAAATTSSPALARTLIVLGRDGRAQLEKAKTNGNGAHA